MENVYMNAVNGICERLGLSIAELANKVGCKKQDLIFSPNQNELTEPLKMAIKLFVKQCEKPCKLSKIAPMLAELNRINNV